MPCYEMLFDDRFEKGESVVIVVVVCCCLLLLLLLLFVTTLSTFENQLL